jgi:hypothetical protein
MNASVKRLRTAAALIATSVLGASTAVLVEPAVGGSPFPAGTFTALATLDRTLDQMIHGIENHELRVPLAQLIDRAFQEKHAAESDFVLGGTAQFPDIENSLTNIDLYLNHARGDTAQVSRRVSNLEQALRFAVSLSNEVRLIGGTPGRRSPVAVEADDLVSFIRGVIREARDPNFSESGLKEEIADVIMQKGRVIAKLPKVFGLKFGTVFLPLEGIDLALVDARDGHSRSAILAALEEARGEKLRLERLLRAALGPTPPQVGFRLDGVHQSFGVFANPTGGCAGSQPFNGTFAFATPTPGKLTFTEIQPNGGTGSVLQGPVQADGTFQIANPQQTKLTGRIDTSAKTVTGSLINNQSGCFEMYAAAFELDPFVANLTFTDATQQNVRVTIVDNEPSATASVYKTSIDFLSGSQPQSGNVEGGGSCTLTSYVVQCGVSLSPGASVAIDVHLAMPLAGGHGAQLYLARNDDVNPGPFNVFGP